MLVFCFFIVYTDYAKTGQISHYFFALLLFVIGLMAKPMLVSLPFVLLLFDYWPLGRFAARSTLSLVIEKLPFLAFSIASSAVTLFAQQRVHAVVSMDVFPIFLRAQNATFAYIAYIGKLFWHAASPSSIPTTGIRRCYSLSFHSQRWSLFRQRPF